jgi:hypothetical protein
MSQVLDRDSFREGVFARDGHKCVICGQPAKDAHHIIERRLFPDGGYYLDNGASLCQEHHIQAEETTLSCEEIRAAAKIEKVVLPPHLYRDERYDKWGNPYLPNGAQRVKGELFDDESVQKVLPDHVKATFTKYVKYPRTWHLPWSPGATDDDRILPSTDIFEGRKVVVTVKMDGENTTLYNDYMHARSVRSEMDVTKHWVKSLQASKGWAIPEGYRVCGENMFAKHSILYNDLPTFFLMFSIWNDRNECLSWSETKEWADLLEFQTVPTIYEGMYDEDAIKELYRPKYGENEMEGYIVRLADAFHYRDFRRSVGKFVRKDHVRTSEHWKRGPITPNKLKE